MIVLSSRRDLRQDDVAPIGGERSAAHRREAEGQIVGAAEQRRLLVAGAGVDEHARQEVPLVEGGAVAVARRVGLDAAGDVSRRSGAAGGGARAPRNRRGRGFSGAGAIRRCCVAGRPRDDRFRWGGWWRCRSCSLSRHRRKRCDYGARGISGARQPLQRSSSSLEESSKAEPTPRVTGGAHRRQGESRRAIAGSRSSRHHHLPCRNSPPARALCARAVPLFEGDSLRAPSPCKVPLPPLREKEGSGWTGWRGATSVALGKGDLSWRSTSHSAWHCRSRSWR